MLMAVAHSSRAVAHSSRCCQKCMAFAVVGTFLCIALSLVASGVYLLGQALSKPPAIYFDEVDGGCIVESVDVERRESSNTNKGITTTTCYDEYLYDVCTHAQHAEQVGRALEGQTCFQEMSAWNSEEAKVCSTVCSQCTSIHTTPLYTAGASVTCWQPAPGKTPSYPYSCSNKQCYKLVDPADEQEEERNFGAALAAIGLLFSCCFIGCLTCFCREHLKPRQMQGPTTQAHGSGGAFTTS